MNKKGYTLIEIITVVSLIGILVGLSIPKISTDFGYLDNSAAELLKDVRYIQTEVMKNPSNSCKISVDSKEHSYYIIGPQNNKMLKSVKLKNRYTISYTGNGNLYFNSSGVPINPGTFRITDTKTSKFKEITVVVATGRSIILE